MIAALLLKGCLIGFSIAMPVGPIGLLCVRNSLSRGLNYGLMTGLGAATADALFGLLGGMGMAALNAFFSSYQLYFQIAGALFLTYLGWSIFKEDPKESERDQKAGGLAYVFSSTFFLTLVNPMTLFSFAGIYAGVALGLPENTWLFPLIMTTGIFIGSACWWLILSSGAYCFKNKMNVKARKWINRISGSLILGFAFLMLASMINLG